MDKLHKTYTPNFCPYQFSTWFCSLDTIIRRWLLNFNVNRNICNGYRRKIDTQNVQKRKTCLQKWDKLWHVFAILTLFHKDFCNSDFGIWKSIKFYIKNPKTSAVRRFFRLLFLDASLSNFHIKIAPTKSSGRGQKCVRGHIPRNHWTDFYHFWPTTIIYDADEGADGILGNSHFFGYFIPKKLVFWPFLGCQMCPVKFQPNDTTQMHQNINFTSASDGYDARSFKTPIF